MAMRKRSKRYNGMSLTLVIFNAWMAFEAGRTLLTKPVAVATATLTIYLGVWFCMNVVGLLLLILWRQDEL